jgi:HAD superfamily hydrolase (TIGR01662 family)
VPPQPIHAILFDLGDTLIHARSPWQPTLEKASRALTQVLFDSGLEFDETDFHKDFLSSLESYYTQREDTFLEASTFSLLQNILVEKGYKASPRAIRAALDAYYTVTRTNWQPEDDAPAVLHSLHRAGYRLGILSNAGDDNDVRTLVDKVGITSLMDFIVTSAACGIRKPHRRIFELALSHWEFAPENVAMIGDRLDADVLGANQMGMFSVWIKRRTGLSAPGQDDPSPAAIIETLRELPGVLQV